MKTFFSDNNQLSGYKCEDFQHDETLQDTEGAEQYQTYRHTDADESYRLKEPKKMPIGVVNHKK